MNFKSFWMFLYHECFYMQKNNIKSIIIIIIVIINLSYERLEDIS